MAILVTSREALEIDSAVLLVCQCSHWDGFDDKIVSTYAGGMTVEEIRVHLGELYGVDVSRDFISRVTDRVLEDVRLGQNRPIDEWYPVIWIDALVVKIRVDGVVRNRPAYHAENDSRRRWRRPTRSVRARAAAHGEFRRAR